MALFLACISGYNSYLVASTDELANMTSPVIVDARTAEAYATGHIPGAVNFDPELVAETEPVRGLLRPSHRVIAALEAAGIDPDRRIVVYSGMEDGSDFKQAARVFWILEYFQFPQVSYLDGGLAKWKLEGRPVSTEATVPKPVKLNTLYITPSDDRIATHKDVVSFVQNPDGQNNARGVLVDMRPPSYYAGLEKKDFVSTAGPIPGAVNLPAEDLLDPQTHLLKDKAALTDLVRVEALLGTNVGRKEEMKQPLDENTPVITYCNTGRDASTGYLLFRLLGYHDVKLYDGSMAEWSLVNDKTAPSQR